MKRDSHPIDDFFRESLKDTKVTPSAQSRIHFLEEAALLPRQGGFKGFRWNNLLGVAGLLIVTGIMTYVFLAGKTYRSSDTVSATVVENSSIQSQIPAPNTPQATLPATETTQIPVESPEKQVNTSVPNPNKPSTSYTQHIQPSVNPSVTLTPNGSRKTEPAQIQKTDPGQTVASVEPPIMPFTDKEKVNKATKEIAANVQVNTASPNAIPKENQNETLPGSIEDKPMTAPGNDVPATSSSSTSVPSTPPASSSVPAPQTNFPKLNDPVKNKINLQPYFEYSLDNQLNSPGTKPVHTLSLGGQLQKGRFIFSVGAGYAMTNGFHSYQVEYNDYLGRYKKLDSITFAWDQNHYHLLPSYYMSETSVWDSLLKLDSYSIENRYSLLKMPVKIGYQVYTKGWFSLSVNTGAEFNFFIDSKQGSGEYSAGQKKVIQIHDVKSDLERNRHYLLFDLSAACNLNRRISIAVEPQMKYFLNPSETDSKEIKSLLTPWIRTTLKIKF